MNFGERKEKVWRAFNAFRGYTPVDRYTEAAFLINKTKRILREKGVKPSQEECYETMLTVADKYEIINPFENAFDFYKVFQATDEELDWEMVLLAEDDHTMSSRFYIPEVLLRCFDDHISNDVKTILIPEAEKFALTITETVDAHPDKSFTLTTINSVAKAVLDEIFAGYENVCILQTSIYMYEFSALKFDFIMSVPVFGVRDKAEESPFICREYDLIAVENLLLHLNSGGELMIVIPARITFAAGDVKELREFIQSMYCLKEIAELPGGIFLPTSVKTMLFTLTTGRTEDVAIKRLVADTKNPRRDGISQLIIHDETFVMLEELQDMGDWNVDKVFALQDEDYQRFQNSDVRKKTLGEVADIFRGKNVAKKDPTGNIGFVNISNLGVYSIVTEGMDHINEESRKVANYLLEEGDVLIPARGTAIRIAVFEEQSYPCIASSNIVTIRPHKEVLLSSYLKLFLDSPMGRTLLSAMQQGTTVMNISYNDLKAMEVPIPPLKEQQKIADEYEKELKRYHKSIQDAEERWQRVVERLQREF
ncbi:MAG: restriction endonuclease subunit S [Lachnospiraceae bacterium]|nr:restriction endonuclease subunit S [Lachnospiraceae bacterium]